MDLIASTLLRLKDLMKSKTQQGKANMNLTRLDNELLKQGLYVFKSSWEVRKSLWSEQDGDVPIKFKTF